MEDAALAGPLLPFPSIAENLLIDALPV